jgi:hypothetical protein
MTMREQREFLPAALVALFLASVVALGTIYFTVAPKPGSFELEIVKAILQLGIVSVVGAAVSVLVFEHQRARQRFDRDREHEREQAERAQELDGKRLEYREDLLKLTLTRTMAGYNSVKKARRLMRARAISVRPNSEQPMVLAEPYDTYMELINDAQLDFENLARDVETSKRAFSSPDRLVTAFRSMDKFLGALITEYETVRKDFQGIGSGKALDDLPLLAACLGPTRGSDFEKQVVHPYHEIQKEIRADLLHPQLPGTIDGA